MPSPYRISPWRAEPTVSVVVELILGEHARKLDQLIIECGLVRSSLRAPRWILLPHRTSLSERADTWAFNESLRRGVASVLAQTAPRLDVHTKVEEGRTLLTSVTKAEAMELRLSKRNRYCETVP